MRRTPGLLCMLLGSMILLTSCAGMSRLGHHPKTEPSSPYPFVAADGKLGWWYARYQFQWPPEESPSWHLDLLVAHEVVKPVLGRHRGDILLWRFHRRAARDGAGHQFSFIFYAGTSTARRVFTALDSREVVTRLKAEGDLVRVSYDPVKTIEKPNVEDTSDPNWPKPLQKTWPWFIMGVSETWLGLLGQTVGDMSLDAGTLNTEELKKGYLEVNARVTEQWREQGAHAFLHHLNALFGYAPFKIDRTRMIRF